MHASTVDSLFHREDRISNLVWADKFSCWRLPCGRRRRWSGGDEGDAHDATHALENDKFGGIVHWERDGGARCCSFHFGSQERAFGLSRWNLWGIVSRPAACPEFKSVAGSTHLRFSPTVCRWFTSYTKTKKTMTKLFASETWKMVPNDHNELQNSER